MKTTYLVLIRGLPGSGKTTLANAFAQRGFHHFEQDRFFEQHAVSNSDWSNVILARTTCMLDAETALMHERNVVVANLFADLVDIQPYIDMAIWRKAKLIIIETQGQWQSQHIQRDNFLAAVMKRWHHLEDQICLNADQLSAVDIDAIIGQSHK